MMESEKKLTKSFYQQGDVVQIAQALLGKVLVTNLDGMVCKGRIVEVEAYNGRTDKACHAYGGKRTKRTETLYQSGGMAYVYLCYGIHSLFNVVTNELDLADAVLIRALEPLEGQDVMKARLSSSNKLLTNGPGILSKAMGIDRALNEADLTGNEIWIEEGRTVDHDHIVACPRIGIDYAEEDALLPWRFYVKGSKWVSRK